MTGPLTRLTAGRAAIADAFAELERLREATAAVKARIAELERAPRPVSEALDAFDAWADAAATSAIDAVRVDLLVDPSSQAAGLRLPVVLAAGQVVPNAEAAVSALLGLLALVGRAELRRVIEGQLMDLTDGRQTLGAAERQKKIERAQADLLTAELAEESAIRQMEAIGLDVLRRPDADPRALLASDASLPG